MTDFPPPDLMDQGGRARRPDQWLLRPSSDRKRASNVSEHPHSRRSSAYRTVRLSRPDSAVSVSPALCHRNETGLWGAFDAEPPVDHTPRP